MSAASRWAVSETFAREQRDGIIHTTRRHTARGKPHLSPQRSSYGLPWSRYFTLYLPVPRYGTRHARIRYKILRSR